MVLLMFNNANKPLLIYIYSHLTSFVVFSVADDFDDDLTTPFSRTCYALSPR